MGLLSKKKSKRTNYEKGRDAEYYIKGKMEKAGFTVFRLASSKPADLIALNERQFYLVEVKSYRLSDKQLNKEALHLMKLAKGTPLIPMIVHKPDGKHYKFIEFSEGVA